jgi:hypothetical protein
VFIKIGDLILNTDHIKAIRFDGDERASIVVDLPRDDGGSNARGVTLEGDEARAFRAAFRVARPERSIGAGGEGALTPPGVGYIDADLMMAIGPSA